jgi:hypothetical protein
MTDLLLALLLAARRQDDGGHARELAHALQHGEAVIWGIITSNSTRSGALASICSSAAPSLTAITS